MNTSKALDKNHNHLLQLIVFYIVLYTSRTINNYSLIFYILCFLLSIQLDSHRMNNNNLFGSCEDQLENQYPADIQKFIFNELLSSQTPTPSSLLTNGSSSSSTTINTNNLLWEYFLNRLQNSNNPSSSSSKPSSSLQNGIIHTDNSYPIDLINSPDLSNLFNYQYSSHMNNIDFNKFLQYTTTSHLIKVKEANVNLNFDHSTMNNNSTDLTKTLPNGLTLCNVLLDKLKDDFTTLNNDSTNLISTHSIDHHLTKLTQSDNLQNYWKKFQLLLFSNNDLNGVNNHDDDNHDESSSTTTNTTTTNNNNISSSDSNNNNNSNNNITQQMMQYYALCAFVQAATLLSTSSNSTST
ncbi:unnamed protein product [Schistosoma turkestanicum]|nr:unnamed protein product [Schistosoma turkestanicum]